MNDILCFDYVDINKSGIILKSQDSTIVVSFEECLQNSKREHNVEISTCVATRDITKYEYVFYTMPKTRLVFKKSFLSRLLLKKSADSKFRELRKKIESYGYSTYDMS